MDQDHEYFDKNEWVNDEKSFTEKVAVLLPPEVVDECKLMDWSYCSSKMLTFKLRNLIHLLKIFRMKNDVWQLYPNCNRVWII